MKTSKQRRTSSKSGASPKSRTTGTSSKTVTSSQTAPASFEQVFGTNPVPQLAKYEKQRQDAADRLAEHMQTQEPSNALLRAQWRQRRGRLTTHLRLLTELIQEIRKPFPGNLDQF